MAQTQNEYGNQNMAHNSHWSSLRAEVDWGYIHTGIRATFECHVERRCSCNVLESSSSVEALEVLLNDELDLVDSTVGA